MKIDIEKIEEEFLEKIRKAKDESILEAVRVEAFGRKGVISSLLKNLTSMTMEERRVSGELLNNLKIRIFDKLENHREQLKTERQKKRLYEEIVDVSLPTRESPLSRGRIHPVSQIIEEICWIFKDMGFSIAEGPDIETDYYNFTALNFPPEHPAREMHDTFFLDSGSGNERKLLRTHTSPVQIRTMEAQKPPIRIIVPGKAYRVDLDATHTPMFHQIEGLVLDEVSDMRNMRWVLEEFCKAFFETKNLDIRFRSSFFPFTEPSLEVDIKWNASQDNRAGEKWLEVLGCGMVHPRVLSHAGLDPDKYKGFAWGMGVDRMAMLKYGMSDLRPFFETDVRWLSYYGRPPLDIPGLMAASWLSKAS